MSVYDCCMFLNENDVYEIKLNQHWDFVDKFIVLEAGETHTGLKKPFNFDKKRFEKYSDKLIYRTFDSFNKEIPQNLDLIDRFTSQDRTHLGQTSDDWLRDNFQGNYLYKILKEIHAKKDDIILVSCLDEIVSPGAFRRALAIFEDKNQVYPLLSGHDWVPPAGHPHMRPILNFKMDYYAYKFNLFHGNYASALMTELSSFERFLPSSLRAFGFHTHNSLENGGWQFTFADNTDGEKVFEKYRSWAHAKDICPGKKTKFESESKEEALQRFMSEYKLKKVDISCETHPEYMVDNLEKFKDYIYSGPKLWTDLDELPRFKK